MFENNFNKLKTNKVLIKLNISEKSQRLNSLLDY